MTTEERAQKVWEAFCGELTVPPTDDMKEALATAFRVIVGDYESWEDGTYMVKSDDIIGIADELDWWELQ